jgi:hypothetical protein
VSQYKRKEQVMGQDFILNMPRRKENKKCLLILLNKQVITTPLLNPIEK